MSRSPWATRSSARPIRNLDLPAGITLPQRRETVRLIRDLNEAALDPDDNELAARLSTYDLAFRMQTAAPEAFDLTSETAATHARYSSGGANVFAAMQVAKKLGPGKRVGTVIPDSAERYLSKGIFEPF